MNISQKLLKIASTIQQSIDKELLNKQTKNLAITYLYKKINHLTTGTFTKPFANVQKIFTFIRSLGCELTVQNSDGIYKQVKNPQGEITSVYKQFDFTIQYNNIKNDKIKIKGQIIATDIGDGIEQFDHYDIAIILS